MKVFETTAALLVFAAPLLVLAVLAPSVELVRASVVVVPSTVAPTIQSGIAFGADTVLVGENAPTNEALVVGRPVAILAASGSFPRCASILFDQAQWPQASWAYGIVRGFAVDGATSFRMGDNPNRDFWQAMESCDLRGAVSSLPLDALAVPFGGRIELRDCTVNAEVHLLHPNVDLMRCTVTGAGARVSATVDGTCRVDSCLFLNAPLYAVWTGEGTGDNRIRWNRVEDSPVGVRVGASGINLVVGNHVSNCGTGIENDETEFLFNARENVVRDCSGDGIRIDGFAFSNSVLGNGGSGVRASIADHNLVANNGGIGIFGTEGNFGCNLAWMNGADARNPSNIFADPLLCADGESVAANSPAITGSCGQIGALGVGCSTRELLAVNDGARPRLAVRMTKSGLALVSMAHGSTGRLEAFDVSGRRVASAEVREGPTRLALREGMYFLRLTRGAESVSAKVAVVE